MVVDLNKTQPSEKNKNIRVTELLPQKLYRGDSNKYNAYDIDNLLDGEYKFFGLTPEEVYEYGVTFEFTLNRPLYLVRLDDKNTRNELYKIGDSKIKKILERNYGHNKGEIRDSEEKADYEMSSFICKNYDGYITDKMKTDFGGRFHREIMICNPKDKFSKIEQITEYEKANNMRDEYALKIRKTKRSRSYFEDVNTMQIQPISKLSYFSPVKTPPRSSDKASRALSFKTPGGSRRKMRKTKKRRTKQKGKGLGNSKPIKPSSSPPPTKTRKNVNFSPSTKAPSSPIQNKTKRMFISRNKERQKAVTQYENIQYEQDLRDMMLGKIPLKGGKTKSRKSKKSKRKTRSKRQRGGNPNDQEEKDTYLFGAIGIYDYDKVENALNNGANVNARNKDGDTPLIRAIKLEDIDMVYLLLERPDIDIKLDVDTNKELQLAEDLWENMTPEDQEENGIPYAIEDYIITKKEKKRIQNIVAQTLPKHLKRQEDRKNLAMVMSEKDVGNVGDGTMPYELRHETEKYLGGKKGRKTRKNYH